MKKTLIIIVALTILTSCLNSNKNEIKSFLKTKNNNFSTVNKRGLESVGDSIIIPEFEIEVRLSTNAEKKIKEEQETIIVYAEFSGIPIDTRKEEFVEWGMITLGSAKIELFEKRIATFKNIKISKKTYDELAVKDFEVLINVFSGRRNSQFNIIDCEGLQKKISRIKSAKQILKGKLIEGD